MVDWVEVLKSLSDTSTKADQMWNQKAQQLPRDHVYVIGGHVVWSEAGCEFQFVFARLLSEGTARDHRNRENHKRILHQGGQATMTSLVSSQKFLFSKEKKLIKCAATTESTTVQNQVIQTDLVWHRLGGSMRMPRYLQWEWIILPLFFGLVKMHYLPLYVFLVRNIWQNRPRQQAC